MARVANRLCMVLCLCTVHVLQVGGDSLLGRLSDVADVAVLARAGTTARPGCGDFDIILALFGDHFSHVFQITTTPHAPCHQLCGVILLIGCWLVLAVACNLLLCPLHGVRPGPRHFRLDLHCGNMLASAAGKIPTRAGDPVSVSWHRGTSRSTTGAAGDVAGTAGTVVYTLDPGEMAVAVSGWPGQPGWHTIATPTTVTLADYV